MPHSASLRAGRFSETQRIYLLTATTENRETLFSNFTVGRIVVAELKAAQQDGLVESLAWVVMPDHLHWLIALQQGSLSELMRRIKGRSASESTHCQAAKESYGRTDFTTERCVAKKMFCPPRATSSPIP